MMKDTEQDELRELRRSEAHYRRLLDESMDPTFSFYRDGTYRYVNRAFANGVGRAVDEIIGKKIWDIFEKEEADKRFAVLSKVFEEGQPQEIEVRVPLPSGDTYYLTSVKPIINDAGVVETVICTSKNITKRKVAEIALKEMNANLLRALKEIKTLSGLLPICASCKRIRDDKGYWNQIEVYISQHTEADFSHSMCDACAQELYPELDI
ncbi:MAG: PAS domain S-box protein [Desulfosarcinaceae bacterium]|nr:PAS domain S-box protein [Desulfosarcinaceae bacterium]